MSDWRPTLREKRRLRWLRSQAPGRGHLMEDIVLLLADDISRWSEDDRVHLRTKILRRYGLAKSAEGKPS
jgi:hypothetical protein